MKMRIVEQKHML